jgi:hypothetical protein
VVDTTDNCPRVANASQADTDGDGIGNACDPTPNGGDQDADGVPDATDNCPTAPNASQANLDGDGQGDACDADDDGDGVADTTDNCPRVANASQADTDGDGIGNACDSTPSGGDRDLDGVPDAIDNCPTSWNPNQADTNGDGIGDWCQPAVGVAWFAEVTEGDTGTTTLEFSILIWHPSSATQTVAYYTVEDTATAPEDFVAKRGTVTFAPGERLKTVSVVVKGDRISERRSDLLYLALDPAGTTLPITSERGLGLIKDDDQVSLTISNESITEGDSGNKTMTFDLRLSGPSSLALAIYCSPHDGTAVQGRDYSFSFSDVKFKPGQTRKSVEVTIHGDRNREAHEEFTVRCYIGDVFDANVRPFQVMGVGTIRNDD